MSAPLYAPPIGDPPSIELIPPARLRIDERYQRSIDSTASQALINRIARGWDWRLCVPLLVSRRSDGLYVIDGQHRLEGARRRGDITHLPACVSEYGTPGDEAAVFVAANRRRRAVVRVDTFRAAIVAGDAQAIALDQLIAESGLRLARASGVSNLEPGEINCVVALEKMLATHGVDRLGAVLRIMGDVFADQLIRHGAPIVQALCSIFEPGSPRTGAAKLVEVLGRHSPGEWTDLAIAQPLSGNGGQTMVWAMRRAMLAEIDIDAPSALAAPPSSASIERRPGGPKITFEEQMAHVARGGGLVEQQPLRRADPAGTLGGVGSGML